VGGPVGMAVGSSSATIVAGYMGVAVGGIVVGLLQWWLVLRRQVAWGGWWVLASTVGWVGGGFLSGAFDGGFVGWAVIGAVYGAITGAVLVWLLRRPTPAASAEE